MATVNVTTAAVPAPEATALETAEPDVLLEDPQPPADSSTAAMAADRSAFMSGDTDDAQRRFSRNRRDFSDVDVNRPVAPSVLQDVTADADLVKALHEEHGGPLFAFCVRYTGDRGRAEDVVQEVMLRAWRNLDQLEFGNRPIRPWLMTCARNILTDEHRSAAARPRLVNDDNAMAGTAVGAEDIDRAVEAWTIAEALQRLSHEHRDVLVECYWQGSSVAEAAETLGVPTGTVKSRTYYALRALRLALEEMGVAQ